MAAILVIAATPVFGQGRPAIPPGQLKKLQPAPAPAGSFVLDTGDGAADVHVRPLGAWLDDARVLPIREGWLSVSLSRWTSPVASGVEMPGLDVSVGITRRLQASVSAPYFRVSDGSGTQMRGMGDINLGTKFQIRDPEKHRVGLALGPALEIATGIEDGTSERITWLLPLNVEWQHDSVRVYGSGGYFSRGVLSAAAAVERVVTDHVVVTGALSHAYSIDRDALDDEIGLSRRRVDLTGSVSYVLSPGFAVFGAFGRTVSRVDADATRLLTTVGVSMNVSRSRVK